MAFSKDQFNTDFYYMNHAVIMQPFAIFGYLIFHLEKYVSVNNENIQNINNNINKVKYKIFTVIKQTLPITKVVIFVVATILSVMLSKKYGLVDIFERRWNNQVDLYLTWGVLAMVKFGIY